MKSSGELTGAADTRHLTACLLAAHQGGAALTHITGSVEPCTALLEGAVDYVASFQAPEPLAVHRSVPQHI